GSAARPDPDWRCVLRNASLAIARKAPLEGQFGEEAAGRAARGAGEAQPTSRAGDGDIQEAPLLVDLGLLRRVDDRQQPLGQADDVDGVPLETLGGVDRRDRDGARDGLVTGRLTLEQIVDEAGER